MSGPLANTKNPLFVDFERRVNRSPVMLNSMPEHIEQLFNDALQAMPRSAGRLSAYLFPGPDVWLLRVARRPDALMGNPVDPAVSRDSMLVEQAITVRELEDALHSTEDSVRALFTRMLFACECQLADSLTTVSADSRHGALFYEVVVFNGRPNGTKAQLFLPNRRDELLVRLEYTLWTAAPGISVAEALKRIGATGQEYRIQISALPLGYHRNGDEDVRAVFLKALRSCESRLFDMCPAQHDMCAEVPGMGAACSAEIRARIRAVPK